MKRLQMTVTAAALTLLISTAAFGGTITGSRTTSVGTITGSRAGTITGSRAGTITGSRAGTITGSRAGTITGSRVEVGPDGIETIISKVMMLMLNLAW
jgi:outer membrane lipoprotein SlyB